MKQGQTHQYGPIDPSLREQLLRVEPSVSGTLRYRPCRVHLQNGQTVDRVYVQEAESYLQVWGVLPEDDPAKLSIRIEDVAQIESSPQRLPAELANKMYAAGESGMGYCLFTLILDDGRRIVCLTGNAVDFVDLPPGVTPSFVRDLLPNAGRDESLAGNYIAGAPYHWCLYEGR